VEFSEELNEPSFLIPFLKSGGISVESRLILINVYENKVLLSLFLSLVLNLLIAKLPYSSMSIATFKGQCTSSELKMILNREELHFLLV